ncbi:MAG: hypothetical protein EWM51_03635 [Treponema sp.]|nr:MAG: hypothetical protein EWM51_03635 [Treponema sp.]
MNFTVVDNAQVVRERAELISIDKSYDIIPVSVGLYSMFLANGKEGMTALMVYQHLIYTGRLQETNQVWANDEYLANALPFGKEAIRRAKTFLHRKGLIKYVQDRTQGRLGPVYIRICFMTSAQGGSTGGMEEVPDIDPAPPAPESERAEESPMRADEVFFDDEEPEAVDTGTADDRYTDEPVELDTGTPESRYTCSPVPLFSGGAVHRCTGAKQQMLEVRNEMLEARNKMSVSPPADRKPDSYTNPEFKTMPVRFEFRPNQDQHRDAERVAQALIKAWYARYAKETARLQNPSRDDVREAVALVYQFPDLLSASGADTIADAVTRHFDRWRYAWFLIVEQTRKLPESAQKPFWNFRNFCRHFAEIRDLEAVAPVAETVPGQRKAGGMRGVSGAGAGFAGVGCIMPGVPRYGLSEDEKEWVYNRRREEASRNGAEPVMPDLSGDCSIYALTPDERDSVRKARQAGGVR